MLLLLLAETISLDKSITDSVGQIQDKMGAYNIPLILKPGICFYRGTIYMVIILLTKTLFFAQMLFKEKV